MFIFGLSNLLCARLLMAMSLGFHIVLAVLGVGMPVLMLFAEWRFLRSGDEEWRTLAKRWSKAFAVLFAVGAVSGTVLSFELGLLWPRLMGVFGPVFGMPFTLEGFAFFLEGIFVGIYLYGWERIGPRAHWLAGWPIAISGGLSAAFVVLANAWMNTPTGFRLENGKIVEADPFAAMMTAAAPAQVTHMLVAAYMTTGFLAASVYAVAILRGRGTTYHRRALSLSLLLGVIFTPIQAVVGDWAARVVAQTQPAKLAAMEGQFKNEKGAPLRIGGWPNQETRETRYAIEIPGGLSWLAYHDRTAEVRGVDSYPQQDRPPVTVPHVAFQLMVGAGGFLLLLSLVAGVSATRRQWPPNGSAVLAAIAVSGPLSVLALEAGWVVTEVGRQPWIVHGWMRTADAVTDAPDIGWTALVAAIIYLVLAVGTFVVLRRLARTPFKPV